MNVKELIELLGGYDDTDPVVIYTSLDRSPTRDTLTPVDAYAVEDLAGKTACVLTLELYGPEA